MLITVVNSYGGKC